VLLHKGRVLFSGDVPDMLKAAQADSMQSAFMRLTQGAGAEDA
jgi:hypothetical protein